MDGRLKAAPLDRNPAYVCAALLYLADIRKGRHIVVMMPYVQALKDVSDWFRQLWAESLGKRLSLTGEIVHVGQTPVKALGATDQHSQMQLYVEGPHDKVIVFLAVDRYGRTLTFPAAYEAKASLGYFAGKTMNDLIQAERIATTLALAQHQRPNMTLTLPEVNPHTIGQLLYLLEVQTLYAGGLYGIDPLDQPGVEAGKAATYALMGRKGYEQQRVEIEREIARDERYLL
jgi:glucose-6-phosphate isomerase